MAQLVLGILIPHFAHATYHFGKAKRRNWSIGIELGARYFTHYNQTAVISTPPGAPLGEAQLQYWTNLGAIYAGYGSSISSSQGPLKTYGFGVKFPFVTFSQSSGDPTLGGIQLLLIAEGTYYSFPPAVAPAIYQSTGIAFRYGGGIYWGIKRSGAFLDTTMMVSNVQGNFFIAPLVGLGIRF